ncbi:MAG: FtsW/RodA/SpoVE family cell cycle protein, partial [Dongiaceae bacterium]
MGSAPGLRLTQRIRQIPWSLVILITMVASIGFAMLYSAANGNVEPWMDKQMVRFAIGVCIMLAIGMVDLQRLAKIAYPLYAIAFVLLVYVEFFGEVGMGAQRWIDL